MCKKMCKNRQFLTIFFDDFFSIFDIYTPTLRSDWNLTDFEKFSEKFFRKIFFRILRNFGDFWPPKWQIYTSPAISPIFPKNWKICKNSEKSVIFDHVSDPHFTNLRLISSFFAEISPIFGRFFGGFPFLTERFRTLVKNRGFWTFYKIRCFRRFSKFWKKVENFSENFRDFRNFQKNRVRPPYFTNLPAYNVILGPFLGQNRGVRNSEISEIFKNVQKLCTAWQNPLRSRWHPCTKKFLVYSPPVGYGAHFFRPQKIEVLRPKKSTKNRNMEA